MFTGLIGFGSGLASPSRDLLIRAAAPKGATGRVYGTVYSGLDVGFAIGLLLFGVLMDRHLPALVFAVVGVFQFLAIGTAVTVGHGNRTRAAVRRAMRGAMPAASPVALPAALPAAPRTGAHGC